MELSERQKSVVATAVTILSVVVILAAVGTLFWLIGRFLHAFSSVFLPLAVAGVVALVLQPYYTWLRQKLRLPTPLALVALFLSVLLPVVGFAWFFGAIVAEQVSQLLSELPGWWDKAAATVQERWPQVKEFLENHPLGQRLKAIVSGQEEAVLEGVTFLGGKALSAGAGVLSGLGALLSWAVTPVYLVFFLIAKGTPLDKAENHLPFLKEGTRKDLVFLVREFVNIIVAFFRGQLLIAFMQGVLFAIGFTLAGLKYGFVLGLALGFLNIIPYLGSIVGLGVCLPLGYFQTGGGLGTVIGVLVVFGIVQLIEGYVLTPKIMGDRTGLHPMAIIVSVFFWGSALNGIMGMILAIPLTAFLVVFWRLAQDKYIREWV